MAMLLAGCGDDSKNDNATNTAEKNAIKKLVVGVSADYPPFEFIYNGQVSGFDIDLADVIAKHLGLELEIKDMPFHTIIPSLQHGDINVAISGMTETVERAKSTDFSKPYYSMKLALLVHSDSKISEPVITNGMRIGAQTGSTMYQWIMDQKRQGLDIDVLAIDNNLVLVEELKNKKLDGVLLDGIVARDIQAQRANSMLSVITLSDVNVGDFMICLKKGDPMLKKINETLEALKISGMLDQLEQKWGL